MVNKRPNIKAIFFLATMTLGLAGCLKMPVSPQYQFKKPTFQANPAPVGCKLSKAESPEKADDKCVVLLAQDFLKLLVELEASCVALTGDKEQCQIIQR